MPLSYTLTAVQARVLAQSIGREFPRINITAVSRVDAHITLVPVSNALAHINITRAVKRPPGVFKFPNRTLRT